MVGDEFAVLTEDHAGDGWEDDHARGDTEEADGKLPQAEGGGEGGDGAGFQLKGKCVVDQYIELGDA